MSRNENEGCGHTGIGRGAGGVLPARTRSDRYVPRTERTIAVGDGSLTGSEHKFTLTAGSNDRSFLQVSDHEQLIAANHTILGMKSMDGSAFDLAGFEIGSLNSSAEGVLLTA